MDNLQTILDVNKKAIEIHMEVERQQEDIIEGVDGVNEKLEKLQESVSEIEKALFRLAVAMAPIGLGTIAAILKILFFSH